MGILIEILQAVSVICASVVAIIGVNSWRREIRGKKQLEISEEILTLIYECQSLLDEIRLVLSISDEAHERQRSDRESETEAKYKDLAFIVLKRYQERKVSFNKLFALRFRFKAYFGDDAFKLIEKLKLKVSQLLVAAQMLPRNWMMRDLRENTGRATQQNEESIQRNEAIIWKGYSNPDQFSQEIDDVVAKIEKVCRPVLEGKKQGPRRTRKKREPKMP